MKPIIIIAALVVLSGCTIVHSPASRPGNSAVHVPPGHMPPPGQCRIWYPDRPPGHQPPPGNCTALQYKVPRGAYLIRG